jgi:hypothetical protein
MNPPHQPGHLSHSSLSLSLVRQKQCADCKADISGPPNMKRCKPCHRKFISRTRAARMRKYRGKKRNFNATAHYRAPGPHPRS